MVIRTFAVVVLLHTLCLSAGAQIQPIFDYEQWQQSIGDFTTVEFTEYPKLTVITDQLADQGVVFTDGDDVTHVDPFLYPEDDVGLTGGATNINIAFDPPHTWFGLDYPGVLRISFFLDGELIFTDLYGGGGTGHFIGLVGTGSRFDRIELNDPRGDGGVFIDNLHFGAAAPADVNADGFVDVDDLITIILAWGGCPPLPEGCPADTNLDGVVDVDDLIEVLQRWG